MPEVKETNISPAILEEAREAAQSLEQLQQLLSQLQGRNTTDALHVLLAAAVEMDASDIHMEPVEEGARMRLRLDGLLQEVGLLSLSLYESLLSRLKLTSGIKLNVADRPQDGRFTIEIAEREIEVRSSTLPSQHGETVVLRLLDPKRLKGLGELGLRNELISLFREQLKRPNGMIIVTGPTGSGKTTTLYAFLQEVKSPEKKIVTIEDPIEYQLEGVSQTQVQPEKGYDFASGLRAIVRQDPDVILVGEIRDGETADIALQAALTGHLVFSTLHTNDAAGTIARLTSMGSEVATVAPALNLIVAQRLVRKVCTDCAAKTAPGKEELALLQRGLKGIEEVPGQLTILKAKGCPACHGTGYQGRVSLVEALALDEKARELILTNPSIPAFRAFAQKAGMITMYQDGLLKVLEGITTIEEVQRVASAEQ